MDIVHHGEKRCEREGCPNGAYWAMPDGKVMCGVHSKKAASARRPLPKDPNAKRKRTETYATFRARTLVLYTPNERVGHIECVRLVGRGKQIALAEGWLNIFPNNWHTSRTDGEGMPELSPMRLGPVTHGEPGIPDALNIENYHQFSKCYWSEVDEETLMPALVFYERLLRGYQDQEPHRHKFDKAQMAAERELVRAARGTAAPEESANAPAFAVHRSESGAERHFTYVESRWFYCVAYEKLAVLRPEYQTLVEWREVRGISLRICGYDGYDMGVDATADKLYEHYCDAALPFGHERVLYALLLYGKTPELLPWHRYRRENAHMYNNICSM